MSPILVPIDGSDQSERALADVIRRFRSKPGARVALLYVREPPSRSGRLLIYQPRETIDALGDRRAEDVVRAAATRLEAEGLPAETHVEHGPLFPTIAAVAARLQASEIVLGVRTPWFARLGAALARRVRPLERLHVPVTYPA